MDRLQLITILSWADGPVRRRHIQKTVYCLQEAGWELGCRFRLLKSGVYSLAVMDAYNDLAVSGFVTEESGGTEPDGDEDEQSCSLLPTDLAFELLRMSRYERKLDGREVEGSEFQELGRRLLRLPYDDLKHAATVIFFLRAYRYSWDFAVGSTLVKYRLPPESAPAFESLAASIVGVAVPAGRREAERPVATKGTFDIETIETAFFNYGTPSADSGTGTPADLEYEDRRARWKKFKAYLIELSGSVQAAPERTGADR